MGRRLLPVLGLAAALGLGTPAVMADHGGQDKHQHGNKHDDQDDDHAWERRDGYEYRVYGGRDERPPGWGHGKKTGWGNCGLPPGQAKKYGCRTYVYDGRPHYYYQDEVGRIIVRRPIVEVHGSASIHYVSTEVSEKIQPRRESPTLTEPHRRNWQPRGLATGTEVLLADFSVGGLKLVLLGVSLAGEPSVSRLAIEIAARAMIERGVDIDPHLSVRIAQV